MSRTPGTPPTENFLRRITAPLRRPLDGRVADINRRVGDARKSVEEQGATLQASLEQLHRSTEARHTDAVELSRAVDAYAASSAEAASYTGVELRRLAEVMTELATKMAELATKVTASMERAADEVYQERLHNAAHFPLEELDEALAAALNHAAGHRGFASQAGLWLNPPVTVELSRGDARLSAVNERIVEIPFASAALGRLTPPARILDIGSAESTFPLSAASLGYRVTAIDLHPLAYAHPNLESVATRLEDWDPGEAQFDAVFLISTIEHFGLAAYGEPAYGDPDGPGRADRAAMLRLSKLLTPEGFLVLTAPYGPAGADELERTYDDEALSELLDGWDILDRRTVMRRDEFTWLPATRPRRDKQGVVMVIAAPSRSA